MASTSVRQVEGNDPTINLVELLPVPQGIPAYQARLCFTLHTYPIHLAPSYTAISRVDDVSCDDQETITVGNNMMTIRKGFHALLKKLRARAEEARGENEDTSEHDTTLGPRQNPLLWVDTLCYDMNNSAEKSMIAQMIPQIFRHASQVVFWLGTADQGSTSKTALTYFEEHGLKDVEPYDGDNANLQHSSVRIWTQSQGKAIFELFTRPFWKQIWTITHISFASQETIKLLCGSKEVGWAPVANTIKKLQLIQDHGALHRLKYGPEVMETPGFQIIHYKTLWDASTVEHKISSMRETIESTVDFTAKDPRDKIFAILPFTHKQSAFWSNFDVKPDYSKSPQDVFLESIRATVLFEEFQARADRATFAQTLTASMDIDIQANDALRAATNQVLNIHHIDTFWTQDFFLSPLVQVFAVRQLEDMPSRTAPFLADPLTLDIIIMWVRHVILQLESMYQTLKDDSTLTILSQDYHDIAQGLIAFVQKIEQRLLIIRQSHGN